MTLISPAMLDLIVAGVVLEAGALAALALKLGKSWLIAPLTAFLAAGAALMFAVRLVLSGAAEPFVGAALISGFGAHVACIALLFRRAPRL